MPLKLKDGADTEGLPTITLAGEKYFVARMRLRERIAVAQLMPKVQALYKKLPTREQLAGGAVVELSADDYLIMVDVARYALAPLYPSATRDDLLDEEIEFDELFEAYPVIIEQGKSRRPPAGEAQATSQTNSSGDGSSPI